MSKREAAVFTNMCMVHDSEGNILVMDRQKKDWPGITFPGGKVEKGESFVTSVIREVKEETGLTIKNPILCGVKQFQDLEDARYVVFLYKASEYEGNMQSSAEGEVFWIKRETLNQYALANDFEMMVELFEDEEKSEFYYYRENDWKFKML